MTYEQVIKDLHACIDEYDNRDCGECSQENWRVCRDTLMKQCLDLINRQKADIERIKAVNAGLALSLLTEVVPKDEVLYREVYQQAKSEAINEFADKLMARIPDVEPDALEYCGSCRMMDKADVEIMIDNLVEEMAEER